MTNRITKKTKYVQDKTLLIGVDVSQEHLDSYGRGNGQETKNFQTDNTYEGLTALWANIKIYQVRFGCDRIMIGYESTGHYGEPLKNFMKDKGVKLVQINPMHTKRVKNLNDNSPGSTDHKDPRIIVDIMQLGHYLSVVTPVGPAAELRSLSYARESLLQERTRRLNRLESLAFRVFPELVQTMKALSGKTARYLLKHYPTPESIGTVSIDELTQVIKKVSRGRLGREVAARLQQVAATSLGTKEGRQGMLYEIDYILEQLDWVERKISAIAGKITEQLAQIPYAQKLLSIKGIGKVILAGIIGEVGDFRHYHKSSELIKLAGLDIYEISSGKYRGQRHISKCGRWLMRKLLYFASLNLVRNQGHMKEYYQRLVGQGMIKTKALIAVSRKLLSIMFAMVRDGTEYLGNESAANGASSSGATKIPA